MHGMIDRRRLMLLAPSGVLALGLAGAAAYLSLRPEQGAAIGGPFTLVDGDGRTVTDRQFRGRWMMVYFGYTQCPDACPTALQDMANALDLLPTNQRKEVALVFITVDPERDTPSVVKDYVSGFEAGITALSGSANQVADAARAYRVYYAKHPKDGGYDMDHSSIIYLMDPKGRFVANFTHETPPDRIASKLKAVL